MKESAAWRLYCAWFGETPAWRKQSWGLLGVAAMVSPFVLGIEILR